MSKAEKIEALKQHAREFVQMDLTDLLDANIEKLAASGALDLEGWDGVNLKLPRVVTCALLDEAARRVIWDRKKYGKEVANVYSFL